MNLKEAFRFQNKLQALTDEANRILWSDANVTKVQTTYLRHKVMPEAEDETVVEIPDHDYTEKITRLVDFSIYLLSQREKLSAAIRKAKDSLPVDIDTQASLNSGSQQLMRLLLHMNELRGSWNGLCPVTRKSPNPRAYDRSKARQAVRNCDTFCDQ